MSRCIKAGEQNNDCYQLQFKKYLRSICGTGTFGEATERATKHKLYCNC